ncbi:PDZ domain-containing protein [Allorhodopirellula heiligendammensis]|uniref:Periplasmic serine endoprotease DegP-like n=1 Tax=Allorhodopirellula heiligendammensis TaxID=2714739 RepID=A0A5C6BUR3_9BACT|nr:PDZ domain-containing protein [Allorhodopirellula heiligendammensis]TWU15582.1 putative periplasmic serine endoprotease DegP-like precursor [Allorhodopirellula heiligendammensis]
MRRVRTACGYFAVATALATGLPNLHHVQAQDETEPKNAVDQTAPSDDATHTDHHAPQLGVLVGSCPGEGVCVIDTLRGGPADRVGVEPGDYILAINDQTVSNPLELKKKIDSLDSEDTINLNLWRRGKYVNKEVRLAKEADTLPESHRAWLGIVLAPASESGDGALIREVAPGSPAETAGLRRGDEILKLNGKDVQSLDQFVGDVGDFEPGDDIKVMVRRDGNEQEIAAELGQVVEAPIQWFRDRMPMPSGTRNVPMLGLRSMPSPPIMDEMIDDMRQQIRMLRREVDQLKQAAPDESQPEQTAPEAADDDLSIIGNPEDSTVYASVVPHIPSQNEMADRLVLAQISGNFPPNISNDWSGARYTSPNYAEWRARQQQGVSGNTGGTSYPNYIYGNGNFGYGYPGYNNYRYYQYRGRPYYYGRGYPYRYRGGIRYGTGLGVYW